MENDKSNNAAEAEIVQLPERLRSAAAAAAVVKNDPAGGWEKCWEQGLTPWDMGDATPVIRHLVQTDSLPKGRALVPGCGTGYDVVAMASPERYVVGLDISETATKKSTEKFSSSPNAEYFSFKTENFFTWKPTEKFDLIFDYTFLCALDLQMRPSWAKQMHELLNEGGELLTLMFPMDGHKGGPPFSVSVTDYEEILLPLGFTVISIEDNEHADESRKGIEKVGRWKKSSV